MSLDQFRTLFDEGSTWLIWKLALPVETVMSEPRLSVAVRLLPIAANQSLTPVLLGGWITAMPSGPPLIASPSPLAWMLLRATITSVAVVGLATTPFTWTVVTLRAKSAEPLIWLSMLSWVRPR